MAVLVKASFILLILWIRLIAPDLFHLKVKLQEGRRHAVSHLRIMRLRCSLCGCGSFFCSDMRTHLQYRHCDKLHLAPKGYVLPGNVLPCMTQRQVRTDLSYLNFHRNTFLFSRCSLQLNIHLINSTIFFGIKKICGLTKISI